MGVDVFAYLPTRLRIPLVEKLIKYSLGSATGVVTDVVVFLVCRRVLDLEPMSAHLVAVAVATVPNYTINRYWTWQQSGRNRLWGEVIPFWVMAFLGFALATLFVGFAKEWWTSDFAVLAAQLTGFGVVWPAKYLVLDKLMWKVVHDHLEPQPEGTPEPAPVES